MAADRLLSSVAGRQRGTARLASAGNVRQQPPSRNRNTRPVTRHLPDRSHHTTKFIPNCGSRSSIRESSKRDQTSAKPGCWTATAPRFARGRAELGHSQRIQRLQVSRPATCTHTPSWSGSKTGAALHGPAGLGVKRASHTSRHSARPFVPSSDPLSCWPPLNVRVCIIDQGGAQHSDAHC